MDEELVLIESIETIEEAQEEATIAQEGVNVETSEADTGVAELDSELDNDSSMEETTLDVLEVETVEEIEIEIDEAIGWVPGDSSRHYSLYGRDEDNQHPISAITGLKERLGEIERLKVVESSGVNVANYYKWDGNKAYDEHGYFVSLASDPSEIKICDGADIFGVSVDAAGFIGGQDATVPRDNSYGLIVTSGLVDVRCELDINIGDCVVSNAHGYAKKADFNYGYKVLGRETKNGIEYAVIALGVQADKTNELGIQLAEIQEQVDANYTNIISAVNVANQAYNKVNEIGISNQEISEKVDGAVDRVEQMGAEVGDLGSQVAQSTLIATQAKAIAESAATSAESMKNAAVEKSNEALAETSELRKELEATAGQMQTDFDNVSLELEAAKGDLKTTKENMNVILGGMQDTIDDTKSKTENLATEIDPVVKYEKDGKVIGAAGFVSQSDSDHVLLGQIATWKDGSGKDSFAGYIEEVGKGYATIGQLALTNGNLALVKTTADTNQATIDALTSFDVCDVVSIIVLDEAPASGVYYKQEPVWKDSDNKWVFGTWNEESEQWDDYTDQQLDVSTEFCYAEATKSTYYKYSYNSTTNKWNRATMGKTGASIAGVKATSDANKAQIDVLASWKSTITDESGELKLAGSVTGVEAKANAQGAYLASLASYDLCDVVKFEVLSGKPSGTYYTDKPNWDSDSSQWKFAEYDTEEKSWINYESSNWSDYAEPEDGTDENSYYVLSDADNTYYQYAYKDSVWSRSELGRDSSSIAGVKSTADANEAKLDALASYQAKDEDGNPIYSVAGVTAHVDKNSAEVSQLATYNFTDSNGNPVSGAAGLVAQVDENKSELRAVANRSFTKDDGTVVTGLAGLNAQVTENESNISLISKRVTGKYTIVPEDIGESKRDASKIYASYNDASKSTTYYYRTSAWNSTTDFESISTISASMIYYVSANQLYWYYENNAWKSTNDASTAGLPAAIAGIQVVADDNSSSINSLASWSSDTNTAMARIEQKADANGAYIQSTVSNMDKYSVGPYSQVYGFTLEQAGSVLEEGMIYVPTTSHQEEYQYTDSNKVTQTYSRTFTPQYLYKWGMVSGQYRWITVDKNYTETSETNTSSKAVYFTTTEPAVSGNFGYWYASGDTITGTTGTYDPYTLYKWESYVDENEATQYHWVAVATLAGNSQSRAVSQIRQDTNSIELRVTNTEGSAASSKQWIDDNSANIQDVVSWKSENGESLVTFMQTADENYASASQVAKIVDEDGNVIESSIVTAVNNNASSISLSADSIEFTGQKLNIKVDATNIDGTLTIGQLPTTVAKTDDIPTKTSDLTNDSGFQNETGVVTIAKGAITADHIASLNLEVGNQIKMGANATISWDNVDGKDDVASKTDVLNAKIAAVSEIESKGYQNAGQVTQITKDTISTTTIMASQVDTNGLQAEYIQSSNYLSASLGSLVFTPRQDGTYKVGLKDEIASETVVIPQYYNEKQVVEIDKDSFANGQGVIKTLAIPASVTEIPYGFLEGYSVLEELHIPLHTETPSGGGYGVYFCHWFGMYDDEYGEYKLPVNFSKVYLSGRDGSNVVPARYFNMEADTNSKFEVYLTPTIVGIGNYAFQYYKFGQVYHYGQIGVASNQMVNFVVLEEPYVFPCDDNVISGFRISSKDNNMINSPHFKVTQDGEVVAKKGDIAGWEIAEDGIHKTVDNNTVVGMSSGTRSCPSLVGGDDSYVRFYAGSTEKTVVVKERITSNKQTFAYSPADCKEMKSAMSSVTTGGKCDFSGYGTNTLTVNWDGVNYGTLTITYTYESIANPFTVLEDGSLYASAADISGSVRATEGSIGDLSIEDGCLIHDKYSLDQNGLTLTSSDSKIVVGNTKLGREKINNEDYTVIRTSDPFRIVGENGTSISLMDNPAEASSGSIRLEYKRDKSIPKMTIKAKLTSPCVYSFTYTVRCQHASIYEGNYYVNDSKAYKFEFEKGSTESSTFVTITSKAGAEIDAIRFYVAMMELWDGWIPFVPEESDADFISTGSIDGFSQSIKHNNVNIQGHLLPQDNSADDITGFNIGNTDKKWNHVYARVGNFNILYSDSGEVTQSDRNKKNTISDLSNDYDLVFDKLRPVTFKYNDGTSNRLHTGFIAPEVRDAVEDVGLTTKDFAAYCEWEDENKNITCGLRYTEFIALCVDQIQKLKKRVEELEEKLNNTQ